MSCISFSADSKRIITGTSGRKACIWDTATGGLIAGPLRDPYEGWKLAAVCLSPDGRKAVTVSADHSPQLWDVVTGEDIRQPLSLPHSEVETACFSPNGETLATGSRNGSVVFWNAHTAKPMEKTLRLRGSIVGMAFSLDSNTLAAVSKFGDARLWDVAAGKTVCEPLPYDLGVISTSFSGGRETVVSWDHRGHAQLWDVITGKPLGKSLWHLNAATDFVVSPDGVSVAAGGEDGVLRFWELAVAIPEDPVQAQAWSAVHTAWEVGENGFLRRINREEWSAHQQTIAPVVAKQRAEAEQQKVRWHRQQASNSETNGLWSAVEFHLTCLVNRKPDDAGLRAYLERARRRQQSWKESGSDLPNIHFPLVADAGIAYNYGLRLFATYHYTAYNVWKDTIARFGDSSDPNEAHKAVSLAVLWPVGVRHRDRLVAIAKRVAASRPDDLEYMTTLGAALLRAGKNSEALHILEMAAQKDDERTRVCTMLFLAMTLLLKDSGDLQAQQWIEKAYAETEQPSQFIDWEEAVRRKILWDEVDEAIQSRLRN
ncbi:MAG: hypothetical protein NTY19_43910 [Planctomycetota bacterium]|nr:hypothetical protein [Planctomycetota bacterium]